MKHQLPHIAPQARGRGGGDLQGHNILKQRVKHGAHLEKSGPPQGGPPVKQLFQIGYSLFVQNGYLHFAVRTSESELTTLRAPEELSDKIVSVGGKVDGSGVMTLLVNGKTVAEGSAGSPLPEQPDFGVLVGKSGRFPVGDFPEQWSYDGYIQEVVIRTAPPGSGVGGPFDGPF